MLNYLKQLSFGLDISASDVSAVKLYPKGRRLALAGFNSSALPAGLIRSGQIQDETALRAIIKKTVAQSRPRKINDLYTTLVLPEQSSFLEIVQLPKMTAEELKEAIKWEIEANIPLSLESVYYDWQILPMKDIDHFDILIAAAAKDIIDSYVKVVKEAGFFPKSIETAPLALCRALIPGLKAEKPILIIELSKNIATVAIFSGEAARFSSSIPLSGRYFAEMAATEWVRAETGEKKMREIQETPIFTNFLIEQIRSFVEFYEDHSEHEHRSEPVKISQILLCGSGIFSGLDEILTKKLKIESKIANPFVNFSQNPGHDFASLSFEEALSLTKALGAASRDFLTHRDKL
ncbi:MAG: pilus assembly protein PilM [bacterium]|nr:pilus assembly protein PilM [bacterium]